MSELAPAAPPGAPAAYRFNVTVLCADASAERLAGLATLLTQRWDYGGTRLASSVRDAAGNAVKRVHVRDEGHALALVAAALEVRAARPRPRPPCARGGSCAEAGPSNTEAGPAAEAGRARRARPSPVPLLPPPLFAGQPGVCGHRRLPPAPLLHILLARCCRCSGAAPCGLLRAGHGWLLLACRRCRPATAACRRPPPLPPGHRCRAIFQPAVAQVWADNLADLWCAALRSSRGLGGPRARWTADAGGAQTSGVPGAPQPLTDGCAPHRLPPPCRGNLNMLQADLFTRVLRLQRWGVRATTLRLPRPASPSAAAAAAPGGGSGPPADAAAAAAVARRRLAAAAGEPPGGSSEGSGAAGWHAAAQCWALRLARRLGGEAAVQRLQPWVLR